MRRVLVAALVLALLPLAGCGGRTGLIVRIDPPPEYEVGVDFNKIRVEVTVDSENQGQTVSITPATPEPYRAYVYANDEKPEGTARILVQLWMNGEVKKELRTSENFEVGELREVVVAFP